jgi:hypothetical protein
VFLQQAAVAAIQVSNLKIGLEVLLAEVMAVEILQLQEVVLVHLIISAAVAAEKWEPVTHKEDVEEADQVLEVEDQENLSPRMALDQPHQNQVAVAEDLEVLIQIKAA